MSLIKMMLVMVSVAAISKTFGLLRFLLRLSFLAKRRLLPHLLTLWVCKLLMLICILTKNVITSCSVTMMLFLHLEVKPLMTLTTVLYLSCAGYSMPIAVRYTQDAFSRSGWLWPVDAKGEPLKATSYMAVGFYVAKYVNKKSDMDLAAKGLGAKEWNNSLKTKLSLLPKKLFRIRMSR